MDNEQWTMHNGQWTQKVKKKIYQEKLTKHAGARNYFYL